MSDATDNTITMSPACGKTDNSDFETFTNAALAKITATFGLPYELLVEEFPAPRFSQIRLLHEITTYTRMRIIQMEEDRVEEVMKKSPGLEGLDKLINQTRKDRGFHAAHRRMIDASACSIREKALLDARAVMVGKVEKDFKFEPMGPYNTPRLYR